MDLKNYYADLIWSSKFTSQLILVHVAIIQWASDQSQTNIIQPKRSTFTTHTKINSCQSKRFLWNARDSDPERSKQKALWRRLSPNTCQKVHPRCRIFGFRWWRLITVFALRHLTSAVCSLFSDVGVSQIWARPHSLFSELILMWVPGSRLCWWIIVLWSTLGSLTHPPFLLGRPATQTCKRLVKQLYTAVLMIHSFVRINFLLIICQTSILKQLWPIKSNKLTDNQKLT